MSEIPFTRLPDFKGVAKDISAALSPKDIKDDIVAKTGKIKRAATAVPFVIVGGPGPSGPELLMIIKVKGGMAAWSHFRVGNR